MFALIGKRVFEHVSLARWTRTDAWFVQVQGATVVVANSLDHGLSLLNDFVHVGFHGFFPALNGEERSFHVARKFGRGDPFDGYPTKNIDHANAVGGSADGSVSRASDVVAIQQFLDGICTGCRRTQALLFMASARSSSSMCFPACSMSCRRLASLRRFLVYFFPLKIHAAVERRSTQDFQVTPPSFRHLVLLVDDGSPSLSIAPPL